LTEAGYTAAKKHVGSDLPVRSHRQGNALHSKACRRMTCVLFLAVPMALITALMLAAIADLRVPQSDLRRRAEEKGLSLLRSRLTPEQDEQWSPDSEFEVVGCDTGARYRITNGTTMNVIELDQNGRSLKRWCFTPVVPIVQGDLLLAKIALETMENYARSLANSQRAA
jgi:hypothetical protein